MFDYVEGTQPLCSDRNPDTGTLNPVFWSDKSNLATVVLEHSGRYRTHLNRQLSNWDRKTNPLANRFFTPQDSHNLISHRSEGRFRHR